MSATEFRNLRTSNDLNPELRNRFKDAVLRIKGRSEYQPATEAGKPYGSFGERHLIGECTPIDGGIYFASPAHEAIVVDDDYGELKTVYMQLMVLFAKDHKNKKELEPEIFPYLVNFVATKLLFSTEEVKLLHEGRGIKEDQKVALDLYLKAGVGVARHQVLLFAYLVERLKARGHIDGCWYIESQYSATDPHHERITYTGRSGELFVFDPVAERGAYLDKVQRCTHSTDISKLIKTDN